MAYASYRCSVDAPYEKVWQVLMSAIAEPDRFNPSVRDPQITPLADGRVRRRLTLGNLPVEEVITVDAAAGQIHFELDAHPRLRGKVRKSLVRDANSDGLFIECILDWQASDDHDEQRLAGLLSTLVKAPVEFMKIASERPPAQEEESLY